LCAGARRLALCLGLIGSAAAAAASPWSEALQARDLTALGALAGPGVEVDRGDAKGRTALMLAAARGEHELLARLLELGARVDQRNHAGGTALMYAAQYGQLAAAKTLLDANAAVDIVAAKGWSALMIAVLKGRAPVIELLLARGADPNRVDMHGWTPLMRALDARRESIARTLIANPAVRPGIAAGSGDTALHVAASVGLYEAARALLERGADPSVRNAAGQTPAMLAEAQGHPALASALREAVRAR
jgi:ankyrin repeat protein